MHLKFQFFIFSFLLVFIVNAQEFPTLRFKTYTDKDGLLDIYCNTVVQDQYGLIWVGTKNGISRFDGMHFKSYKGYVRGKKIIRLGHVFSIYPLKNGNIWFSSNTNLFYLNTTKDSFYNQKKSGLIFKENKKIVLRTGDNFYQLPETIQGKKRILKPILPNSKENKLYYTIVYDSKGTPWSRGYNNIVQLDPKTRKIRKKFIFEKEAGKGFQELFFDHKNRLWVSTWGNGVFIFNSKTNKLERVETVLNNQFVALNFKSWRYKGKNYIIVLGDASLLMIDEETLNVKMYQDKEGRMRVFDAFSDKQGNLWLATEYGLKFINSKQDFACVFPIKADHKNSDQFQKAVTFIHTQKNHFFIAKRWFDGVYEYDSQWNFKQHLLNFENSNNLSLQMNSSEVLGIQSSKTSHYFSGYYAIYKKNETGVSKRITPKGTKENFPYYFRDIVSENDSVWWVTYNDGIFCFNPKTDEFVANYKINISKKAVSIHSIMLTTNKRLILSTTKGLFEFKTKTKQFVKIHIKGLETEQLFGLSENSQKHLWLMTENGIIKTDLQNRTILYKTPLSPDLSFGEKICVDQFDNVWFQTNEGYCCYVERENEVCKFPYSIGLPDNRLEWFSMEMTKGNDGYIYAGAIDAIVRFNPRFIQKLHSKVEITLTELSVNDEKLHIKPYNKRNETITLPAGSYFFSLCFSVPDYSAQSNYELYYCIGTEKQNWIKSKDGIIKLNNLTNGNYLLQLKGKNNFSGKYTNKRTILIQVAPYWWQTWWFYFILLFLIGSIVWSITRYFLIQRVNKKEFQRKIQESEMKLLRSQMNPHFMFNTLNAINNFIVKNKTENASDYLTLFSKLMRNILENSEKELITLDKEIKTLEMYLKLEQVRLNNTFDYEIEIAAEVDEEHFFVPPLIIQPYCENAIWHGIMNNDHRGFLAIRLMELTSSAFVIIIQDNGIGRIESGKLKQNEKEHKSYGLQITEQRLKLLHPHNKVEIIDLYSDDGLANGTKVILTIYNNV